MKISIIIACVDKHIPLLKNLLKTIKYFTRKPDEIIVSFSPRYINNIEYLKKNKNEIEEEYNFVKCLVQNKQTHSSENRNKCMQIATGDIFVLTDPDDIMHPQKLEIVEKIFNENYECKMLLHNYLESNKRDYSLKQFKKIEIKNFKLYTDFKTTIKWKSPWGKPLFIKSFHKVKNFRRTSNADYYHNSFITIRKEVFDKIKFDEKMFFGEDANFLRNIHEEYQKTYFINENLQDYIESRSWR